MDIYIFPKDYISISLLHITTTNADKHLSAFLTCNPRHTSRSLFLYQLNPYLNTDRYLITGSYFPSSCSTVFDITSNTLSFHHGGLHHASDRMSGYRRAIFGQRDQAPTRVMPRNHLSGYSLVSAMFSLPSQQLE